MIPKDPSLSVVAVARNQQIKALLLQADKDEEKAMKELAAGKGEEKRLAVENRYLKVRVELYNEKAQIEADLVHAGESAPDRSGGEEVVRLAQQLDLGNVLKKRRSESTTEKSCWTNCVECVTNCTECVTDCTECVTRVDGIPPCKLHGTPPYGG